MRFTDVQRERLARHVLDASGDVYEALGRPYAAIVDAPWLDISTRCRIARQIHDARMGINSAACALASLLQGEEVVRDWEIAGRFVRLHISGNDPMGRLTEEPQRAPDEFDDRLWEDV